MIVCNHSTTEEELIVDVSAQIRHGIFISRQSMLRDLEATNARTITTKEATEQYIGAQCDVIDEKHTLTVTVYE